MRLRTHAALVAGALLTLPAAASAAQGTPVTLTGQLLYQAETLSPDADACSQENGNTTYDFEVDDGFAIGPYPGTFDEQVTVTIGPLTGPNSPFPPFDLPGENDPPIPGTTDVGLNFQAGSLLTVQATFTIETVDGRTVVGTKTLSGTSPAPAPSSGACTEFDLGTVSGYYQDVRAYDLEYEARIHTDAGTFVDEGSSVLTAREGIAADENNGNLFFRVDDLLESFTSTLEAPVELKPGLGCGDLNHVHERADECKNQV